FAKDPRDGDSDGIPGIAGDDYPTLARIPDTGFSCRSQELPGYYADQEAQCQVFYICQLGGRQDGFLCPNGTLFNQQHLICDWWYNVDCELAMDYFSVNERIYAGPASSQPGGSEEQSSTTVRENVNQETAASVMNEQTVRNNNDEMTSNLGSEIGPAEDHRLPSEGVPETSDSDSERHNIETTGTGIETTSTGESDPADISSNTDVPIAFSPDDLNEDGGEDDGLDGSSSTVQESASSRDTEINKGYIPPREAPSAPSGTIAGDSGTGSSGNNVDEVTQNTPVAATEINNLDDLPEYNDENPDVMQQSYGDRIPQEPPSSPTQIDVPEGSQETTLAIPTSGPKQEDTTYIGYSLPEPSSPLGLPTTENTPISRTTVRNFPPPEQPLELPDHSGNVSSDFNDNVLDQPARDGESAYTGYSYPTPTNPLDIDAVPSRQTPFDSSRDSITNDNESISSSYLPPPLHRFPDDSNLIPGGSDGSSMVDRTLTEQSSMGPGYSYPTPDNPLVLPGVGTPVPLPTRHYLPPEQ
ncbi:sialidase-like, partial [Macrobrachium nipponense]|uniref:sialidase-like n=1 Tax=Macrobrachium nipponense TaxID=159736 RepID=UPI0030C8AFDC